MTDTRSVEERISSWFDQEEAGTQFPDPILRATFDHTRELRQARSSGWRTFPMFRNFAALAATGAAAVVLAVIGVALLQYAPGLVGDAPSPSPTPGQATATGGMWPQSTIEEVRVAQERADAGDPAYTWQLDAEILNGDIDDAQIIARFLRQQLGWEEYLAVDWVGDSLTFVKCAPGQTNGLYPNDERARRCAPTLDEFRYETVRIDIAQPVRSEPTGIWVVSRWSMIGPFAQADPAAAEARATARLEEFLDARLAGAGADGYVDTSAGPFFPKVVPLLYGTSTGATYERYEIDVVGGPHWPHGDLDFGVRLFAAGGQAVVEQPFSWGNGLFHDPTTTKENGQFVGLPFSFFDGEVVLTVARPWRGGFEREALDLRSADGFLPPAEEAIVLVGDPLPGCALAAPADSAALASSLGSDPDLQATAPVRVNLGGLDAVTMEVTLAPGASRCTVLHLADGSDRRGANIDPRDRMRLYLIDMPEGSSMRILGIAVVAPGARFEEVLEAATPVLDSIEFHAP